MASSEPFAVYMGPAPKDQTHAVGAVRRFPPGASSGAPVVPVQFDKQRLERAAESRRAKKRERDQKIVERERAVMEVIASSPGVVTRDDFEGRGRAWDSVRRDLDRLRSSGRVKSRQVTFPGSTGRRSEFLLASREWPKLPEGWKLVKGNARGQSNE